VRAEQMPCGRAHVRRDPAVIAAASLAVAMVAASTVAWGVRGLLTSSLLAGASARLASPLLMRRVLHRSVSVQNRTLATERIDVVVGSSFGGAVALELLASGAWTGPTVLLCPAHALVADRARRPVGAPLATLPAEVSARVIVVPGRRDETVPYAHSEALVAGSGARLMLVDDDHRGGTAARRAPRPNAQAPRPRSRRCPGPTFRRLRYAARRCIRRCDHTRAGRLPRGRWCWW